VERDRTGARGERALPRVLSWRSAGTLTRGALASHTGDPMRRFSGWLQTLALLALMVSPVHAGGVAWRAWNQGLAAAAGSGKPVIVDVYTDWCGWCKRMDRDTYGRAEVSDYVNRHFVMVRLNAESNERVTYA